MEEFWGSRRGYNPVVAGIALFLLLTGDVLGAGDARGDGRSTSAGAMPQPEGASRGFPAMLDSSGKKIADGDFTQWLEGERVHVKISYDLGGGHRIEEKDVLRQRPAVVQEQWSWEESKDNKLVRRYHANFESGQATAEKQEERGLKRWSGNIKVQPGRTFAGFAFTPAIKALRARLMRGEKIELRAVGFTPKPRVVTVEISYGGLDQMEMGQRKVAGERFVIHPKVPAIAKVFVEVHDTKIWLTPPPSEFLRWEGPLLEQSEPMMRVDLLPGEHSSPAVPSASASK
jgi:hypothetical protein